MELSKFLAPKKAGEKDFFEAIKEAKKKLNSVEQQELFLQVCLFMLVQKNSNEGRKISSFLGNDEGFIAIEKRLRKPFCFAACKFLNEIEQEFLVYLAKESLAILEEKWDCFRLLEREKF